VRARPPPDVARECDSRTPWCAPSGARERREQGTRSAVPAGARTEWSAGRGSWGPPRRWGLAGGPRWRRRPHRTPHAPPSAGTLGL